MYEVLQMLSKTSKQMYTLFTVMGKAANEPMVVSEEDKILRIRSKERLLFMVTKS